MANQNTKGVAGLRAKLADSHPKFAAADAFEHAIEDACMRLRGNLTAARNKLGFTQSSLADKMQVGQPVISRIESNTGDIGIKTLYRYVNALGLALVVDIQMTDESTQTPQHEVNAAAVEEALENVDKARELLITASEQLLAAE